MSEEQPLKAPLSELMVQPLGIVIEVNATQLAKFIEILAPTVVGRVTSVREAQPDKFKLVKADIVLGN